MQNNLNDIWQETLKMLEGEISGVAFNTWFKPVVPVAINNNEIILAVSMEYAKSMLEGKYNSLIYNAISAVTGKSYNIKIIYENESQQYTDNVQKKNKPHEVAEEEEFNLNPKYIFDTFIVGNSNRFAHAASFAVAEAPAQAYNPLFLYGGVGLGKTHLMHAIGNYILSENINTKVTYVSSERFTNDLINSIKDNRNEEFRNKYRLNDILLVDDIQFIAGREKTEEEFFHTFNHLYQANKQIILTSDRPPKDIHTLEERLRSRFEWGLICDIQPPDYETRVAILQKKCQDEDLIVANNILEYIASKIDTNIRELEGALTRITAYSKLEKKPLTIDLAVEALKELYTGQKRIYTLQQVQRKVAEHFDFTPEELNSQKRTKEIVAARQIAMYICRQLLDFSYPKIGQEFGRRDHTTVMHAISRIEAEMKRDKSILDVVNDIILSIKEE